MRNSVVSIILAIFLLGSVSLLFVAKKANNNLDKDLKLANSNADSLLKVTGFLNKDVRKFKDRSDSLTAMNDGLEKTITETKTKLAKREREIWKNQQTAIETNKKYNDLVSSQKELDKQLTSLRTANEQLGQENKILTSKTASLNDANKQLTDQLAIAQTAAKDNILIETTAKNGKLNLKGTKVRKIVASLNLQSEMKSPTFRVFDPNGIQLPEQYGSFDLKKINETSMNSPSGNSLKIELTYLLSKKIGPGLYKIEILNENRHIGNLLVRFR